MRNHMTRLLGVLVAGSMALSGCSAPANEVGHTSAANSNISTEQPAEEVMNAEELETLLASQPLAVVQAEYVVQDDQYKLLYPDMLQAVFQNNTTEDIKNAVIAFVAWDENDLPIKIEGQYDFSGGSYVKQVDYADINLVGGETFGEDVGYLLGENNNIAACKAIAVSFETFDGETWENPYYDDFCSLYEGQKLDK